MQNGPSQNLTHETEAHFADVRKNVFKKELLLFTL